MQIGTTRDGRRQWQAGRGSGRAPLTLALAVTAGLGALGAAAPLVGQPGRTPNPMQLLSSARPTRDGSIAVTGLGQAVTVFRDDRGVPDIAAGGSIEDAQRALGFLHAQERFFQMHLARSYAAGRVAAFAGPSLRGTDEGMRRLGLAEVADELVLRFDPETRRTVEAYTAGVNAGLLALGDPPIELQQVGLTLETIERWRPRDTVLVLLFMWDFLSADARDEPWRGVLADAVSPEVFEYLTTPWHRDDVMADGRRDPAPAPSLPGPEALAGASVVATGEPRMLAAGGAGDRGDAAGVPGSNGWAVAGSRTVHGRAILASDPHLMLAAPGVWYRATMRWDGGAAHGVTLPGSPGILIGSNERVAWGFTNTTGDFQDLVVVEPDPEDASRYRVPGGTEAFAERTERIDVLGAAPVDLKVRSTRWGPIVGDDHRGRPVALRWTGLDADRMNFNVLRLMTAADVDDALDIAGSWYGPSQNMVVAGADGRVGWTLTGFLPDRFGFDGRTPVSWADGAAGWRAGSAPRPRVVEPEGGRIITANSRTLPLAEARRIGHAWANPSRAARIAERLEAMPLVDERAMLDLQLDDQVRGFLAWRDLVVAAHAEAGAAPPADPDVAAVVAALAAWDGRATLDTRVLSVLARLRGPLGDRALERLLAPVPAVAGRVRRSLPWDEPALRILQEQPAHLLPEGFDDWNAVIRSTVAEVVRDDADGPVLRDWRETNIARVRHPLSPVVPELSAILDMPPVPIPGHWWAVRVHSGTFGVSTRLVVAPGLEAEAFCHIPAGQSGHPGERDYRSSHADWVRGTPSPLLPGSPVATLRLVPAG
jgi:penicillin amidase